MDWLNALRWLHIIGATVLLGTGAGIAFFMLMAHRTRDPSIIAHVAGTVVVADFIFTTTAVILQPLTGVALAHLMGWPLDTPWLLVSIGLYVATGLCWLPVIWIQVGLRNLARGAAASGQPLDARYEQLVRLWLLLGFFAFAFVLAIIWLMVTRPTIT